MTTAHSATPKQQLRPMTFIEAVDLGYIHRQGKYRGAPWICSNRQYKTAKEALAAANASYSVHAPVKAGAQ